MSPRLKSVNLSIKGVPDRLATRLRRRAAEHHRSLQGELMVMLEESLAPRRLTIQEARRKIARLRLHTPEESVRMLRADRDAR